MSESALEAFWAGHGDDLRALGIGLATNLAAGLLVAWIVFTLLEKRLSLKGAADAREERRKDDAARQAVVAQVLETELRHNREMLATALQTIESTESSIAHPLFELNARRSLTDPNVFSALDYDLRTRLLTTYNRMATANEANERYYDALVGMQAALTTSIIGIAPTLDQAKALANVLGPARAQFREALADRLQELRPHLEDAIHGVETLLADMPKGVLRG